MKSMRIISLLSLTALLLGCGDSSKGNSSGNPVTAPVDYLGAVNKAQKSANKIIDIAPIKQAIQLFHAQEDRYPKDLQELVANRYIVEVPTAPAGSQLSYNPQTGELKYVKAQ